MNCHQDNIDFWYSCITWTNEQNAQLTTKFTLFRQLSFNRIFTFTFSQNVHLELSCKNKKNGEKKKTIIAWIRKQNNDKKYCEKITKKFARAKLTWTILRTLLLLMSITPSQIGFYSRYIISPARCFHIWITEYRYNNYIRTITFEVKFTFEFQKLCASRWKNHK